MITAVTKRKGKPVVMMIIDPEVLARMQTGDPVTLELDGLPNREGMPDLPDIELVVGYIDDPTNYETTEDVIRYVFLEDLHTTNRKAMVNQLNSSVEQIWAKKNSREKLKERNHMSTNGRGKLFEYAVLYHPKPSKDENERGISPKSLILKELTSVLATSDKEVGMLAAREIDPSYLDKLDDVEILIRPL
jgi:hypothetical protein